MPLQKAVNQKLAAGVPGSFYDDSPRRVAPYIVSAGGIAKAYTVDTANPGKAILGGEGIFAGIAVNSKEYPVQGLTASLDFEVGANAQLAEMGCIFVAATTAVTVGQVAFYNTTDGTIASGTAGAEVEGHVEIKNSQFKFVNAAVGEVAILQLG